MERLIGPWTLANLRAGKVGAPKNGLKVFSLFHCGGGSSMGYKLAGFDVLGGVEIDPDMMAVYRKNHAPDPRFSHLCGVADFNQDPRHHAELKGIDVLDGSPPCSSFSMAGNREDDWGKEKHFNEGQAAQVLDELFFHMLDTVEILKPKVVVAENVKGLIQGDARKYVREIFRRFDKAGYGVQLYLLNSSRMGVPQARERTFFVARRRDLGFPAIALRFDEPTISITQAWAGIESDRGKDVSGSSMVQFWERICPGEAMSKVHPKGSLFGQIKLDPAVPSPTMTSKEYQFWHWESPRLLSRAQVLRLQTFPDDYDFMDQDPKYVCGMSVPPFMMQRVALEIRDQFFKGAGLQMGTI